MLDSYVVGFCYGRLKRCVLLLALGTVSIENGRRKRRPLVIMAMGTTKKKGARVLGMGDNGHNSKTQKGGLTHRSGQNGGSLPQHIEIYLY